MPEDGVIRAAFTDGSIIVRLRCRRPKSTRRIRSILLARVAVRRRDARACDAAHKACMREMRRAHSARQKRVSRVFVPAAQAGAAAAARPSVSRGQRARSWHLQQPQERRAFLGVPSGSS